MIELSKKITSICYKSYLAITGNEQYHLFFTAKYRFICFLATVNQ